MKKGEQFNEYGTLVGVFECDTCGTEYTVCPNPTNPDNFQNCLAPSCDSYDIKRDVDLLFDDPEKYNEIHGIEDAKVKQVPTGKYN